MVFPCKGQVKDGDKVILPPEGLAKVRWQFNIKDIKKVLFRSWQFTSSDGTFNNELLARIHGDGIPEINSKRLVGVEIEKPATLVLKNVNQSYNGSYTFSFVAVNVTVRSVHTRSTVASTVSPSTKIPQTNTTSTPICEEKTYSIATFFVGGAVTLLMVLLILFVFQIYKRRCRSSKLPTSVLEVDSVAMQNQTTPGSSAKHPPDASRNHQDDYETSTVSRTAPNEEIYTLPQMNKQNIGETRNGITFQNLLRSDLEHAYSTVPETAPYENVQNSTASVYTELDTNQRHKAANDHTYQQLLKYKPDYVKPPKAVEIRP